LLVTIISLGRSQQTAWQWVNPLPQGNILNGVWAVNQDTVFAVGDYGTVIRSINGGTTWNVLPTAGGMLEPLYAAHFVSGTTGYAAGASGQVIGTTDAGTRWTIHQVPTFNDLFAVSFASPTVGWVAGAKGSIFGTTDGGLTWSAESTNTILNLYGLQFIDALTGYAVGASGRIMKTTDAGATWTVQTSGTTQPLYSVTFLNATTGYAAGAFGTILKTVNGGATWTPQISTTTYGLYSVQFATALTGWAAGAYGTIVKTTNGGISWAEQSSSSYNDLYATRFISSTVGWAVGDFGSIVKTTDGGATWVPLSSGTKNTLNAVSFPSASNGFAVGEEGTIIRSTDGGLSWSQVPSGLFQTLYGVYFLNSTVGWAVGDSAVILKTTNGGFTWNNQNSRSEESLYSIYFLNATLGWAVGDFGTILSTTNGGTTWLPSTTNTFTTFLRVKFVNATTGWAVGYGGAIYKTIDGGVSWDEAESGTSQTLYALDIIDANTVYVSGDFGTILKTTDGGLTWAGQTTNNDASFYGITFFNGSNGWVAGDDGTIMATSNGGATWKLQNSGTAQTLWEIQSIHSSTGGVLFAAGYGGTVIASGVSPLPVKTWTGVFDSSWTNPGNWSPNGVPEKLDSVIIPATANKPVLKTLIQQVNIAALRVGAGQKLTVGAGVAEFAVKRSINVDGVLEVDPQATTNFVVGENFVASTGATFTPGLSTVLFTNSGTIRGSFNTVVMSESAHVRSLGNVSIKNYLLVLSDLTLRSVDTLTILNPSPSALQGNGTTGAGTIKRAILPGSTEPYRFESPASSIRFYATGTLPDTITMSTFPNTLPPDLPDTIFAKRYYAITAKGGSNYMADLSLRFDTSETKHTLDELALFRDSSDVIRNMGQSDFLDSDYVAVIVDSVRRFSKWYIGQIDYIPVHKFEFLDSLYIHDNGNAKDTLYYGAVPFATDGIDPAFGEAALAPKPGAGTFDVRFVIPFTQGSIKDVRDVVSSTHVLNTYTVSLQPGPGGYPFTLQWNSAHLPSGTFLLRDAATHGLQFSVNMKSQSSATVTNAAITSLEITHNGPVYYAFNAGWNIVSLPLTPPIDGKKTRIFPTAASSAYAFNDGYILSDTLKNGVGYWLKFTTPQTVGIDGFPRTRDTLNVNAGWNMLGAITNPVAVGTVSQIPGGNLTSSFFQFSNGYVVTDSLRPARGYWVKAANTGKVVLASSGATPAKETPWDDPSAALASMNTLTVTDDGGAEQTLYFAVNGDRGFPAGLFELPPPPPDGTFDARFATGSMAEAAAASAPLPPVAIRSVSYPLTLRWNVREDGIRAIGLRDAATGKLLTAANAGREGAVRISSRSVRTIAISAEGGTAVPREFTLQQNYPNPFNPSTTIAFELPEPSKVSLKVFNILGQEVAALAEFQDFGAGSHALTFDASNYGSGIYFYQLVARGASREFRQVRKMAFVK
jgi:photosystem II stability/assembly factor-like uncharacterized protein